MSRLHPPMADCSELTVECDSRDYSASAIARAVEDCGAHLLNLDVTGDKVPGGMVVELRVNHNDGNAVARSLSRYGYRVTEVRGAVDGGLEESARERVNALLRELSV